MSNIPAQLGDRAVRQLHGLRTCELLRCRGFPCWGPGGATPGPRWGARREPLGPAVFRSM
eukprot:671546-Alexandrium_andersonii.AAC.1